MTHRFVYHGELLDGASVEKVMPRLASLFKVPESEVAGLFSQDYEFVRDGLDQTTAEAYVALFEQAGALGHAIALQETPLGVADVGDEQNQVGTGSSNASLPSEFESLASKRSGDHATEHVQAEAQFGAHVIKELQAARAKQLSEVDRSQGHDKANISSDLPRVAASAQNQVKAQVKAQGSHSELGRSARALPSKQQNRAARWLRIGGLSVIGTMLADSRLQSALVVDRYGLDLGYLPLIIAHIPLVIGCFLLAKEKKLPPLYRYLGVLSFAGVSILMLMPAQHQPSKRLGLGALAVTAFSCVVFLYWTGMAFKTSSELQHFHERLASLKDGRGQYPSEQLQSSDTLYQSERSELLSLMREVITLVEADSLRPDEVSELSNAMMGELAKYAAWRQYQTFLHHVKRQKLPKGLSEDAQKKDESAVKGVIQGVTQASNKRLYEMVNNWMIGPVNEIEYAKTNRVRRPLDHLYRANFDGWIMQEKAYTSSAAEERLYDVRKIDLPTMIDTVMTKHKHHVEYKFTAGALNGKTLAVGFYVDEQPSRRGGGVDYSPVYRVLNAEVPATYMSGLISVLRNYD